MRKCSWENCNEPFHSRGFCTNHYSSAKAKGLLLVNNKNCVFDGCKFCNIFKGQFISVSEFKEIIQTLKRLRQTEDVWKDQYFYSSLK